MVTTVHEFFGFRSTDNSAAAVLGAANNHCPFLGGICIKTLNDGMISGVCSLKPARSGPVICCPIRLYADNYRVIREVADVAFGTGLPFLNPAQAKRHGAPAIAVFGQRWGGELRLPQRGGTGAYFVDWILARLDGNGDLQEFVAVEVQSIDTTGNYRNGIAGLRKSPREVVANAAGFNWENVNKRILPQVIYKGHVLQREPLCTKGLFFVTPTPVYDKIVRRLGGTAALPAYPPQSGSITFMWWDLHPLGAPNGQPVPLILGGSFTTATNQVALAFSSPKDLPPGGVYENAIRQALT